MPPAPIPTNRKHQSIPARAAAAARSSSRPSNAAGRRDIGRRLRPSQSGSTPHDDNARATTLQSRSTSHDDARDNMSSRPILASRSSQIDPAISLKCTSVATASLRDQSHPARCPFFVNRSAALKIPIAPAVAPIADPARSPPLEVFVRRPPMHVAPSPRGRHPNLHISDIGAPLRSLCRSKPQMSFRSPLYDGCVGRPPGVLSNVALSHWAFGKVSPLRLAAAARCGARLDKFSIRRFFAGMGNAISPRGDS